MRRLAALTAVVVGLCASSATGTTERTSSHLGSGVAAVVNGYGLEPGAKYAASYEIVYEGEVEYFGGISSRTVGPRGVFRVEVYQDDYAWALDPEDLTEPYDVHIWLHDPARGFFDVAVDENGDPLETTVHYK